MIEQLSSRIHFAVFGPDLSYDDGFPAAVDTAFIKEPVSGGKTLAAFRIQLPMQGYYDEQPEYVTRFARYLADGTLDTTFGNRGYLEAGKTRDVKVVPGSRIFVMPEDSNVIRSYTLNGRIDTTFDGDGEVSIPSTAAPANSSYSDNGKLVQVLDDGKLLVETDFNIRLSGDRDTYQTDLARLNVDGSLDTAFGRNGLVSFRRGYADVLPLVTSRALYIHLDYLRSTDPPSGDIIKLSVDGKTADTNFGGDGRVAVPGFVRSIKEQPDGKLVYLQAFYNETPSLYRLNAAGALDTTFSGDGKITLQNPGNLEETDLGFSIDEQSRIVASAQGTIYRFSPSGAIDSYPLNGTAPFTGGVKSIDSGNNVFTIDNRRYGMVLPQQLDAGGIVQINTDYNDDTITITDAGGGRMRVVVNGESRLFRARDVKAFNVQTYDGDLNFSTALALPVTLRGGDGDSNVTLGNGADDVDLGIGNHTLALGGGDDEVEVGQAPRDEVEIDPNDDDRHTVTGTGGNKVIRVYSGSATVTLAAGDHDVTSTREVFGAVINIAGGNNKVRLSGSGGSTVNIGGRGRNDVTIFGAGTSVTTGTGPDKILAISPYGTISTGGGNDEVTIRTFGQNPTRGVTVFAGSGNDHVFTDDGYQSLATVYGGPGDDLLEGSALSQRLYGENGNDTLNGGDGNDYLFGGDLDDLIIGGASSDRLFGDAGNDKLYGQSGNDTLSGGDGDDYLFAQNGNNVLYGDAGRDRLYAEGNRGSAALYGGSNNDLFFTRNGVVDSLYGGNGQNFAEVDENDRLERITGT